ncbi:unnamed protein product [Phytophthora fragariaefolia]|uniref:Unnamed protein product n=1 Tax=Phytophthora fragariaefolia TaxID=1490495 RepID=A0A9W6X3M8_9STRA|nr:unnamed protein product [Phytophthora fragariaefolia]
MSASLPSSKRAGSSSRKKVALPPAFLYSPSDIVCLGELDLVTVDMMTDVEEAEERLVVTVEAPIVFAAAGAAGTSRVPEQTRRESWSLFTLIRWDQ